MRKIRTVVLILAALSWLSFGKITFAQEVSIPDPGLNAAIRSALQKPVGPLTEPDLLGLTSLNASGRSITNLQGLSSAHNLTFLNLRANQLANLSFPGGIGKLTSLDLSFNPLTNCIFPDDLTNLASLIMENAGLTSLDLSPTMTNLSQLVVFGNHLTNPSLPSGMNQLVFLDISGNQITNLTVPSGLMGLAQLELEFNQLQSLTLPPDMTKLTGLTLDFNPLATLVLSETLAATNLAAKVAALQNQGVNVFTYPLTVQLVRLGQGPGSFRFGITGPPGFYRVFSSTNLTDWSALNVVNNPLGGIFFTDTTAHFSPQKFYRAQLLKNPPANMVFIPANTFLMGSPTNEVGHESDEGPQTVVTLSRGFWIGKYEVTQAEFFAVTGDNPNSFPGDTNRPVESVSFFAASNYCVLLTQQDLAAGRIPPGTHYRLPTEAEWECAARAGATNRFYYGDDPGLNSLTNYAWFGAQNGFTTHAVGQKLPNAWGLYDMEGNVWEWCQDWYGPYPGGAITDPQGPPTNPIGWKVIRGGAWESSEFDCRSASRWFEPASPFISDFIIGFRVVLVIEP